MEMKKNIICLLPILFLFMLKKNSKSKEERNISQTNSTFYKFKNKNMIFYNDILFRKIFFVKDSIQHFNWIKLDEKKNIIRA